jgi:NADPH2:quinone reductase
MKAVLCKAFGPAETLVLEDVASPAKRRRTRVLLEVHAAGVNFPDTLIIEGKYQFKPPFPFSPGGEAAGVVSGHRGKGQPPEGRRPGDGVDRLGQLCRSRSRCRATTSLPIPPSMDFASAAAFSMTYGTSMHALKQRGQPGGQARPCWYWARPVAWAWRPWKSARPWAPG